jgi:hypothetical protein
MHTPRGRGALAPNFLPQHYMGLSGQRHAPAVLYPWEWTPGMHCKRGWVSLIAGLDTRLEEKSFVCVGD